MVNQMPIRFRQHIFSGFYGKQKFVWFRHLVMSVSNLFFWKRLPVLPVFCCC